MIQHTPTRIVVLDSLRGFALFGILVVNIGVFASAYYGTGLPDPAHGAPLDRALRYAVALLFETKFYLLFSFLFGYSFTLQMDAAARADAAFVPRFLRRLTGLALLGLAHGILLYPGDILWTYALLGGVLLLLKEMAPGRAARLGATLIASCACIWIALGLLTLLSGELPNPAEIQREAQLVTAAYRDGIAGTVAQNWNELTESVWFVLLCVQAPCALGMFLFGLAAGRGRLLSDPERLAPLLRRLLVLGLGLGLPGALVYAAWVEDPEGRSVLGLGLGLLTAPLLTGAYVALCLRVFRTPRGARLAAALAPAGKMALSNYLFQSLVCALVFTGYGFGLTGALAPAAVLLIALGLFTAQLTLSAWWLRHHPYGPLEWGLRALTLGAWPAWRRVELGVGELAREQAG